MTTSPYAQYAGFKAGAQSASDGGWVSIYVARAQGIDTDTDRYAVVCESHATTTGAPNMKLARETMRNPAFFCEDCERFVGVDGDYITP